MITVYLTDAARCLLSLDDSGMLRERGLVSGGTVKRKGRRLSAISGDRKAILSLRSDFGGGSLAGFSAFDNPGAAKRIGAAAVRAIDAALTAAGAQP